MKNLFQKKIDLKEVECLYGGDFHNSGGTESRKTNNGSDTYLKVYNDNCEVSMEGINYC